MSLPASPPAANTLDPAGGKTFMGHPPGLFLLFFVEMWERFSYYGMRALLVLYLIKSTTPDPDRGLFQPEIINPGRGWTEAQANTLYGWYTGLAYLFPVLGGIIADKFIGTHRSMVLGGLIIALGHIVLAVSGMGQLASNEIGMSAFIGGLALIILGTGHFKPCVSTMVGQLYPPGDPRRDGGFSIFYMGINLGAFLCAFVCGTLGQQVGWHWGFGSAAVGMLAGLLMYILGRPFLLRGIGLPPPGKANISILLFLGTCAIASLVGYAYHAGGFGWVGDQMAAMNATNLFTIGGTADSPTYFTLAHLVAIVGTLIVVGACTWFVVIQQPGDKGPTASIFLFMLFNAFFWIAFEQAGSTMNVFAERSTDRHIFGYEFPATWFQSVNPLLIIIFAPVFGWLWVFLGRRNMNPTQPMKISLGLILLGIGFIFMVIGAREAMNGSLVSPFWLLMAYFWHTMGELCLSPTGLSYVTKAAPARFVSLLMGIWFISSFIANLGGGLIAAQVERVESGELKMPWSLGGRADFFMLFVVSSLGMGFLILIFVPLLKKLLRRQTD